MKKDRQSNIELLRIISIFAVMLCHYSVHTTWSELTETNRVLLRIIGMGAITAINIFVLITGYFGVTSATDTKEKVVRLWKERFGYSILISALMLVGGYYVISKNYVLQAVFPVITCRHNYITTFIMLYLFIPFLNKGIHALTEAEYKKLLLVWSIVISLIPSVLSLFQGLYINNVYSYLMWMVYLYFMGAYFRLYGKKYPYGWFSLICIVVMTVMTVVVEPKYSFFPMGYAANTRYGIIPLLTAICIFGFFVNINVKYNKIINALASSTFAVLLIHDDPLMRGVLWNQLLECSKHGLSRFLVLWAGATVLGVYLSCILIDKILKGIIKILKKWLRYKYEEN